MADGVVYTGFDPEFGDRLNRLIALAKGEGYAPNLISGTRSAYGWPGMKGQSQADLYGQLGKPGGPRAAAPPGYSPHQYGLASDVTGIPQSELERLAPQVGLRAIHGDPNHVELANWQGEAATQPPRMAWDQTNPANVPSRMAMNMEGDGPSQPSRPATATPGAAFTSPMDLVANLESGNRNIPQAIHDVNTDRGTPAGGYFQIIDPTWQRYAPAAGIDVKQFPTAMSADRAVQAQVAGAIPVNQWGPNTVNALKSKFPGIDTSQTLGAVQSAALNGGSGAPSGQGGIGSDYAASARNIPGTTINSNPVAGGLGGQIGQLAGNLKKALGVADDDKAQAQPEIKPDIPPAPPARNVSPLLGNPQIYAQRMAGLGQPLTWNATPMGQGQMPGAGYGPQNQPVYGTSLMSQLQMLSDPMWMNQMAGG